MAVLLSGYSYSDFAIVRWRERRCEDTESFTPPLLLEQNQNKRALIKNLKGGFFLSPAPASPTHRGMKLAFPIILCFVKLAFLFLVRKKPLGSIAFGVQLF